MYFNHFIAAVMSAVPVAVGEKKQLASVLTIVMLHLTVVIKRYYLDVWVHFAKMFKHGVHNFYRKLKSSTEYRNPIFPTLGIWL